MIIVRLSGGLGNQMFQYALGLSLSQKHNTSLLLDVTHFENDDLRTYSLANFNLQGTVASQRQIRKLRIRQKISALLLRIGIKTGPYYYSEHAFSFNPAVLSMSGNLYLNGFWQTDKYFLHIRDNVIRNFSFRTEPTKKNSEMIERVRTVNSVCLHIRRGDYATDALTNSIHGMCSIEYYLKAINLLADKFQELQFFVFSDDLEWAREHLPVSQYAFTFVDQNQGNAIEDLRLMTFCKHFIIANSTFSWWGAWLSLNPSKCVIAPLVWFKSKYENNDIVPANWIRI